MQIININVIDFFQECEVKLIDSKTIIALSLSLSLILLKI